jgi:L-lactate dehydrogenase complex protein LldG
MTSIFDTFKLRAEAVSAEVHRFPHKSAAIDFIVDYLQSSGVSDSPQS